LLPDRKAALQRLLQTLIYTYLQLISVLVKAPPPPQSETTDGQPPSELEQTIGHIQTTGINMHHLLNELRPIQVSSSRALFCSGLIDPKLTCLSVGKGDYEAHDQGADRLEKEEDRRGQAVSPNRRLSIGFSLETDGRLG
jgi:mediator of RNA polymerase II transcription subunit 7